MKRLSMRAISKLGIVPKSWIYSATDSKMANEAMYFCRNRTNGISITLRCYRRPNTPAVYGRCFRKRGIIVLNNECGVTVLAHEVAHMAYKSHGVRHDQLTTKIENYLKSRYALS